MQQRLRTRGKTSRKNKVADTPYAWVGEALIRDMSRMCRTDPSLLVWLDVLVEAGLRASMPMRCEHKLFRGGSGERGNRGWVYVIDAPGSGLAKIGYTGPHTLPRRLRDLQSGSPIKLELVALGRGGTQLEAHWHHQFKRHRRHLEWFDSEPVLQLFRPAMQSAPADGCARCVIMNDRTDRQTPALP